MIAWESYVALLPQAALALAGIFLLLVRHTCTRGRARKRRAFCAERPHEG